ncbi:MAG: DUF167 domain-containing protein [Bacteroidetes bacterium]|nr:DUF167 domain-containing protein [Bacteroidota bacterium]
MILYVKVKPNQRFDRVEKSANDWQIRLKAPAVDGKANEHLIEYLSEVLDLPKSKIILKKGQTAKVKCLEIFAEEELVNAKLAEQLKSEK